MASVDSVAEWRHPYKYRVIKNTSALKEKCRNGERGVTSASRGRLLRERSADTQNRGIMLPTMYITVSDAVIGKGYTSGQPAGEVQHPTSREADPKEDPMVEQALSMLDLEYQRCIAAEAARREHAPALGTEDIAEATEAAEAAGYGAIGSIPCAFSDDDDDDNDEDGGFAYAALENDSDVEDMDASSSSAGMVRTSDGVPAGRLASSSSAVAGSDGDEHRPEDIPEAVVSAAEGHAAALLQERRSDGGGGGGGGGGDGGSGGGSGGDSAASSRRLVLLVRR